MEYTRPATWDDVKLIARHFAEAGVDYALVGGYALAAHGFSRFTEDIDVLVNPSADNARRWQHPAARPRRTAQDQTGTASQGPDGRCRAVGGAGEDEQIGAAGPIRVQR